VRIEVNPTYLRPISELEIEVFKILYLASQSFNIQIIRRPSCLGWEDPAVLTKVLDLSNTL
jgi:hypothetical protein